MHTHYLAVVAIAAPLAGLPRQRAQVAITAHEERDTQGLLTLIWDPILPQL
ncbi:MAG: hypothetical protein LBU47_04935 [Christensenellaceae bacterium]|nr:hypothetical protein [Christensenellaceae bacterium]